jgi:hypothetical protein
MKKNNLKFWLDAIDRICEQAKNTCDFKEWQKLKACGLLFKKYSIEELKKMQNQK